MKVHVHLANPNVPILNQAIQMAAKELGLVDSHIVQLEPEDET